MRTDLSESMFDGPASRERAAFTLRLKQALGAAGHAEIGATAVARMFNAESPERVTTQAVRKWLNSGCIPSQRNIRTLSEMLSCNAAWLRYGTHSDPQNVAASMHNDEQAILKDMASLDEETRILAYDLVAMLLRKKTEKRNSRG